MTHALVFYSGAVWVVLFLWPCNPGTTSGRALGEFDCEAIESVEYDLGKATLFCINRHIWAQCPINEKREL